MAGSVGAGQIDHAPVILTPMNRADASHALVVPAGFDFAATAYSHGWCVLEPFAWDPIRGVLERVLRVAGGTSRIAFAQPSGRSTPIIWSVIAGRGLQSGLKSFERESIERSARRMFRLDADLSHFHAMCRRRGGTFAKAARAGFGRLLRAPTLFEDIVKVLATTNTSWSGTKAMVANLVAAAGRGAAFPTPAQVSGLGASRLAADVRWGYRAEYLASFADRLVARRLDLARWENWSDTSEALEREILTMRGFGPYAAAHVLALLGRHDRIGIDTVFRAFVHAKYFPRAKSIPSDRQLLSVYADWGCWRGLAYWADLWYAHRFENL